eukprot:3622647-Amphidinium_carterae.1
MPLQGGLGDHVVGYGAVHAIIHHTRQLLEKCRGFVHAVQSRFVAAAFLPTMLEFSLHSEAFRKVAVEQQYIQYIPDHVTCHKLEVRVTFRNCLGCKQLEVRVCVLSRECLIVFTYRYSAVIILGPTVRCFACSN